jgi:glycine betaine/proline transport system substrate-binding protein
MKRLVALIAFIYSLCFTALFPQSVEAKVLEHCRTVRIGTVGWLDAGAAAGTANALLRGLGYTVALQRLSVPVILASMKNHDLDVVLEIMVPTMGNDLRPYILDNSVELVNKNLVGTKYTLAANKAATALGIKSFSDIARHGAALDYAIHTVEAGSDGARLIELMIKENQFKLEEFSIVSGTETSLLQRIDSARQNAAPMIFLGWEPHPMNLRYQVNYLNGGDDVFGANYGGADVYTAMRSSLTASCPNLTRLLSNLQFSLSTTNEVMTAILNFNARPLVAAIATIRQQPSVLDSWLDGVTDIHGDDGLLAVQKFVGLVE